MRREPIAQFILRCVVYVEFGVIAGALNWRNNE